MSDSPPSQSPSSTDRYRAMTRAASALFTAESEAELLARLDTWAGSLFPEAEWDVPPVDPEGTSSDSPSDTAGAAVRPLVNEVLAGPANASGDREVQWISPSSRTPTGERAAPPKAVAAFSLSADSGPSRTALLVYPETVPPQSEREAVETFAELARDAMDEVSPTSTDSLIEVANTIASRLELPEAIRVVAEQTSELLNADRSSVWLYDEETDEIYTIVAQKLGHEEIRMPADQGVAGHVLRTDEPVNLTDAYDHPAFDESHDRETGYRTQSMLCMPLRTRQGETLGVFQVINKQTGDAFTAADRALLETLAGSASVAIENALLYEEQQKQFESFIQVLATTIDSRDPTTGQHTIMVTGLAVLIAEEMGLPADTIKKIRVAGILHDVGKIVLPDEVLLKQGELTDSEYEIVQSHASHTIRILDRIHFHRDLDDVPEIAGAHHERLDGDGYPQGLSAEDLTVPMRILAVADVFHALIQDRPYKDAFSIEEALEECRRISGSSPTPSADERAHLDPRAVDALVEHIEREGTDNFRERVLDRSGFDDEHMFAPELNAPE